MVQHARELTRNTSVRVEVVRLSTEMSEGAQQDEVLGPPHDGLGPLTDNRGRLTRIA